MMEVLGSSGSPGCTSREGVAGAAHPAVPDVTGCSTVAARVVPCRAAPTALGRDRSVPRREEIAEMASQTFRLVQAAIFPLTANDRVPGSQDPRAPPPMNEEEVVRAIAAVEDALEMDDPDLSRRLERLQRGDTMHTVVVFTLLAYQRRSQSRRDSVPSPSPSGCSGLLCPRALGGHPPDLPVALGPHSLNPVERCDRRRANRTHRVDTTPGVPSRSASHRGGPPTTPTQQSWRSSGSS